MREEVDRRWRAAFEQLEADMQGHGERIVWGLADGFLLYWNEVRWIQDEDLFILMYRNQDVINQLDVRVFLRVPHDVLKKRRDERHGYHTAGKKADVYVS